MPDDTFKRVLGLPHVTMSGVAVIIGAGIFVLLGPATNEAGGAVWLSFVVAGVLSGLTAFSYMELASMFPKAGSEHEFAGQVFPRLVAVVVGWSMTAALVVAAATVALGFGRYVNEFVVFDERLAAALLLVGLAGVSYLGMERAAWLVIALGLVEVGSLVVVTTAEGGGRNRHDGDDTSEQDAVLGADRAFVVQSLAALHRRDQLDCHCFHVVTSMSGDRLIASECLRPARTGSLRNRLNGDPYPVSRYGSCT